MKAIIRKLIMLSLFVNLTPLIAQNSEDEDKYIIHIDSPYKDEMTIKKFYYNNSQCPIYKKIKEERFYIEIKETDTSKIKLNFQNSNNNSYNDPANFEHKGQDFLEYSIKDPYMNKGDSCVYMQLCKDNICYIIELKVDFHDLGDQTDGSTKKPCDCNLELPRLVSTLSTSKGCYPMCKGNDFGEDVDYYDKYKIVYVYDFNKDPSKRVIWKIVRKNNALVTSIANFSTETLMSTNYVMFKVVNINKFMYDILISDTIKNFVSQQSTLFTELFLGNGNMLSGLLKIYTTSLGITTSSVAPTKEDKTEAAANHPNHDNGVDILLCKIKNFGYRYNSLHAKILQAYNPCSVFNCCDSVEYNSIANDLLDIKIELASIQNTLKIKSDLLNEKKDENALCQKEIEALEVKKKELDPILKSDQTKWSDGDKEKVQKYNDQESNLKKDNCTKDDTTARRKEIDTLLDELKPYGVIKDLYVSLPSEEQLRKMIVFINNMTEVNQTHLVGPVALDGDMLDLKINIRSKDSVTNVFSIPVYQNYPIHLQIPILGKTFASFSSGSFLTFDNKYKNQRYSMRNKTYDWQTINSTYSADSFILAESGYTTQPMGVCAFINLVRNPLRGVGFGCSVGVGLTIENKPRLTYLGGANIALGKGNANQLMLTVGFAGMQVNTLNNNWQAVVDNHIVYKGKPTVDNTYYYSEFKVGSFISLTYSIISLTPKK